MAYFTLSNSATLRLAIGRRTSVFILVFFVVRPFIVPAYGGDDSQVVTSLTRDQIVTQLQAHVSIQSGLLPDKKAEERVLHTFRDKVDAYAKEELPNSMEAPKRNLDIAISRSTILRSDDEKYLQAAAKICVLSAKVGIPYLEKCPPLSGVAKREIQDSFARLFESVEADAKAQISPLGIDGCSTDEIQTFSADYFSQTLRRVGRDPYIATFRRPLSDSDAEKLKQDFSSRLKLSLPLLQKDAKRLQGSPKERLRDRVLSEVFSPLVSALGAITADPNAKDFDVEKACPGWTKANMELADSLRAAARLSQKASTRPTSSSSKPAPT